MSAPTIHPVARLVHGLRALLALYEPGTPSAVQVEALLVDAGAVGELLAEATADALAYAGLLTAKEEELADVRDEACRMAGTIVRMEETDTRNKQEIIALKNRMARAAEEAEHMYIVTSLGLERAAGAHRNATTLRDLTALPDQSTISYTITDQPRAVAVGA